MGKYLSVAGLIARSSFYKVLAVLFAGMLIQFSLFHFATESYTPTFTIEGVFASSFVPLVSIAVYFAVYALVAFTGTQFGSKCGYTINRLLIDENEYFTIQTVYNSLVFLFVWFFEALIATLCCIYAFLNAPENTVHAQSIFLSFYRSAFLHGLIPLEAWHVWLRNIFLAVATGFAASRFSFKQRRSKFSLISLAVPILTCRFFAVKADDWANSIIVIIGAVLVILSHFIEKALKEEKNETK